MEIVPEEKDHVRNWLTEHPTQSYAIALAAPACLLRQIIVTFE